MEPRARAGRHKSSLNFGPDLSQLLFAYGNPVHPDLTQPLSPTDVSSTPTATLASSDRYLASNPTPNTTHPPTSKWSMNAPLPETLRVLDEIVTDFIIETCHSASTHASYAHRQKLNAKDFEFVLRKDEIKMGRVREMLSKKSGIDNEKKLVEDKKGGGGRGAGGGGLAVEDLMAMGEIVGEEGTGKGKGRGRGKRRKRKFASGEEGVEGVGDGDGDGDGVGSAQGSRAGTEEVDDGEESGGRAVKRPRVDAG